MASAPHKAVFLLLCSFSLPVFSVSGTSPARISQQTQAKIRAEVELVNIIFAAIDRQGKPVAGLKAQDFEVFDKGKPQQIEYFSGPGKGEEIPLTIALLIDTSASVKDKLEYEKTTAAEFFEKILRPNQDLALIIQFDSEVNLVQDFTQDYNVLRRALESLRAGNSTSLNDAVWLAVEEKLKHETGRRIIVIIADGEDNSSKIQKEEAIEVAQRSDVLIYAIGVQTENSSFRALQRFASETGGAFFSPRVRLNEIRDAFRAIAEQIEGQYSLAYPLPAPKDGSFRTIEIRCKIPGVRVRHRKGYYAPKAPQAESQRD